MDEEIVLPELVQMVLMWGPQMRESILAGYSDDVIAAAFLDGILACDHPQPFTFLLVEVLQGIELPRTTLNRAVDAIAGPFFPDGTRAACLLAIAHIDDAHALLQAANANPHRLVALEERAAAWSPPPIGNTVGPAPLLSEFEVRRIVGDQSDAYDTLMASLHEIFDFDAVLEHLSTHPSGLVMDAMIDMLLRCPPEEREVYSVLASHAGSPTSLAHTRLVRAAADPSLDMDLRGTCLLLDQLVIDFFDLGALRDAEPWCNLTDEDMAELLSCYSSKLARAMGIGIITLTVAVKYVDADGLERLCDEAAAEGVDLPWRAILYDVKLEPLGPRAAEELAAAGDTSVIDYLDIRADIEPDPERVARYRRAAVRLRAAR